jgi:hypothetical protein
MISRQASSIGADPLYGVVAALPQLPTEDSDRLIRLVLRAFMVTVGRTRHLKVFQDSERNLPLANHAAASSPSQWLGKLC